MPKKRDRNKVKQFAKTYIDNNMDSDKAMREISPQLASNQLAVKKSRWLSSPDVISEITAYIASLNITPNISKDIIRARLIKIITDVDSKDSDAIQAGSVLGRLEGVSNEQGTQVNIGFNIQDLKTIPVRNTSIDTSIVSSKDVDNTPKPL